MEIFSKIVKKCNFCVESTNVILSDGKGKKIHVIFDVGDVASVEVRDVPYFGADGNWEFHAMARIFAVVGLKDGRVFSFLHAKETSDFRSTQLVNAQLINVT
ncbi:MAG TPA: hypothetical protein VKK79_18820 [Candidatus Lokiarchaeia archaeon]|nr:hypothetical protein [Candidatus Lokiarchaeia archaeon]